MADSGQKQTFEVNLSSGDMNIKFLTCLIFFFLTGSALGKTSQKIIDDCWIEGAHPAMAACVERYANAAELALAGAEYTVLKNIAASTGTFAYSTEAKAAFESSIKSFRIYRSDKCSFREIISKTGNASDSIKLACEAELNDTRAMQLKVEDGWLK